jgi:hypothetical protein
MAKANVSRHGAIEPSFEKKSREVFRPGPIDLLRIPDSRFRALPRELCHPQGKGLAYGNRFTFGTIKAPWRTGMTSSFGQLFECAQDLGTSRRLG